MQAEFLFLAFPELCITGATCGDMYYQRALLNAVEKAAARIADVSKGKNMFIAVGMPVEKDAKIYNAMAAIFDGEILGFVPKMHVAKSERCFASGEESGSIFFGNKMIPFGTNLIFTMKCMPQAKIAIEVGSDMAAPVSPGTVHAMAGANIIINGSADAEIVGREDFRINAVSSQTAKLNCAYIYANSGRGESTTDFVFSGHNIIAENGKIISEAKPFENGMALSEIDVFALQAQRQKNEAFGIYQNEHIEIMFDMQKRDTRLTRSFPKNPFIVEDKEEMQKRIKRILDIQCAGLKKRIQHTGSKKLVLGLSGGLDSTLAIIVAARVIKELGRPSSDVLAITMPCFGTTKRTKNNAHLLAQCLKAELKEIDISESVKKHFEDIGHDAEEKNAAYENSQARERTQVLMDMANKVNGLVVGTGDLSELALGWATYNGDHMSMYSVNGGIPKTLMRLMIRYVADNSEADLKAVLEDILATPVSPELLPAKDGVISQQTEDIVGPYELHDFFLYYLLRYGYEPEKIRHLACHVLKEEYPSETIDKWLNVFLRRFFSQQFKRSCLPDGPKVGTVGVSPRGDLSMPSDAINSVWMESLK